MDTIEKLRKKATNLTTKPGVYLMKDRSGKIIYVGKAKSLKNRVSSYFRNLKSHTKKVEKMVSLVTDFDFIVTDTEYEALVLECSLIKQYSPKYNILLKDDKGYHYIVVTDEEYPRIRAVKQKDRKGKIIIGPYMSSFIAKQTAEEVNRVFMLPDCTKQFNRRYKRPCLNYYIEKCSGVCVGKTDKKEYLKTIDDAIDYIKKGSERSIEKLKTEMVQASSELNFEEAIKLRERIKAIEKAVDSQKIFLKDKRNVDVISCATYKNDVSFAVLKFRAGKFCDKEEHTIKDVGDIKTITEDFLARYYTNLPELPQIILLDKATFDIELYESYFSGICGHKVEIKLPQRGEWRKISNMAYQNAAEQLASKLEQKGKQIQVLEELGQLLNLDKTPIYIEAYDVSNLGDRGIVGGMTVFKNGEPYKKAYKKFSMKDVQLRDDYASMGEMIKRRILRFKENGEDEGFKTKPDLILVDGGLGHLNAVKGIMEEQNFTVPVFGMVKDSRHRTKAIASSGGVISVSSNRPVFSFITKIQDETHRFTISYQRQKRNKNALELELTKIDGIGLKRATALFKHFRTKTALKNASCEEVAKVAKVTENKAKEILDFLNNL